MSIKIQNKGGVLKSNLKILYLMLPRPRVGVDAKDLWIDNWGALYRVYVLTDYVLEDNVGTYRRGCLLQDCN